jgi:pyruvate/2-oxoglutarate dehydrogenase complex dihydrolipoamide acyltransferase (E2) component
MSEFFQITVPQLGEGVHHVRVIRILREMGDWVDEDSDLIEIETDKATYEVPAPVAGYIANILCKTGEKLDVGDLMMEIEEKSPALKKTQQKRKGDQVLDKLSKPLKPLHELSQKQTALIRHMHESQNLVVSATIERPVSWDDVESILKKYRKGVITHVPSSLALIAYCAAQAMLKFEKFRGKLNHLNQLEIQDDCHIGLAVSVDEDDLITPSIQVTEKQTLQEVSLSIKNIIESAKNDSCSIAQYHSLAISSMSALGITNARPIVVYPAVATLFIGAPYFSMNKKGAVQKTANLVLTFDHRLINGAYAAKFLSGITNHLKAIANYEEASNNGSAAEKD